MRTSAAFVQLFEKLKKQGKLEEIGDWVGEVVSGFNVDQQMKNSDSNDLKIHK